ncbi:hypothetical protein C1H46_044865 [Malus baccata]|uniref:Uncharacterized protein n=1 Tax=Malus baccata TaxID=106549 RepID=A0A540K6T7_MALBA|nr:hypothetical protein C1H46_044865 [Malus baccata]
MVSTHDHSKPLLLDSDRDLPEVAYDEADKVHVVGINEAGDDNCQTPTFSWKNLWLFTGPGFLMSIVFLDLGNLEGDLQEGAIARNSLLRLLMWATAMRLLVQLLSVRLGVAIEQHLAELCKEEIPCGEGGADCVVEFIGVLTDMQKAAVTCADDWGLGQ